jgi:hypothetical protein
MVGDRWFCSLIEYRRDRSAPIVFGLVLFAGDEGMLVQLAKAPPIGLRDGARWMMAARALLGRLRQASPRTRDEIQAFIALEGNEMRLSAPRDVAAMDSAEATLRGLGDRFLWSVPRRPDDCQPLARNAVRPSVIVDVAAVMERLAHYPTPCNQVASITQHPRSVHPDARPSPQQPEGAVWRIKKKAVSLCVPS